MPFASPYVLIASMDVAEEHEALFNVLYDEHVAHIRTIPGVRHVTRMKGEPFAIVVGGEEKPVAAPDPVYTAIYELDDPGVLTSAAWQAACEAGRWAREMRHHTRKRSHAVYRVG